MHLTLSGCARQGGVAADFAPTVRYAGRPTFSTTALVATPSNASHPINRQKENEVSDTNTTATAEPQPTPVDIQGMELREIAIADIIIPPERHVRRRREHGGELRDSIEEMGLDQPIGVSPADEEGKYLLVIGGGRLESFIARGRTTIPALVKKRDAKARAASTAAENIVRDNLAPAEEADAIEAMLNAGMSQKEAFRKVGLSERTGARRMPLVRMPEAIRAAFEHDGLPASVASTVETIYKVNPQLAEEVASLAQRSLAPVAAALKEGALHTLGRLAVLHAQLNLKGTPPFIVRVSRDNWRRRIDWYGPEDPASLALSGEAGEWFTAQWEQATQFYDRPRIALSEGDVDAAIAAGAAIAGKGEFAEVYIHNRDWLTAQVNEVVLPRMKNAHKARATVDVEPVIAEGELAGMNLPKLQARLERAFMRDLKPLAHGANLDLGNTLLQRLSSVKLNRDTALFFAHQALGRPGSRSYDEGPTRLAACAARVMGQWITIERIELKSKKVKEKVIYLEDHEAEKEMWEFIERARTPEEILGRTLVIFAAAAHFARECGANGQTPHNQEPTNPTAANALHQIVDKLVPPTIARVRTQRSRFNARKAAERQIEKAHQAEAQRTREAELDDATAEKKVLAAFAEESADGLTVAKVALALGIGKKRCQQLLQTLTETGKLRSQGRKWFPPGPTSATEEATVASESSSAEKLAA